MAEQVHDETRIELRVLLAEGAPLVERLVDRVPADGRLLLAATLEIEESALSAVEGDPAWQFITSAPVKREKFEV